MRHINFTDKPISQFTSEDSIYATRLLNGMSMTFHIKFIKCSGATVTGEILEIQPNNQKSIWISNKLYKIGDPFSARLKSCYTYSKHAGAHWFEKVGKDWLCPEKTRY